jgi:hypothetical protein
VEKDYSGTAVAAVILVAMLSGVVYRYWPSEERSIRRHLTNLAETLSLPDSDSEVLAITRFAALREYFDPDVRVRIDDRDIVSRDTLIRLISQWKPPPGGLIVEVSDLQIRLADDRVSAHVNLTASASWKDAVTRERTADVRAFSVAMSKARGDWVISTADARLRD